MADNRLPSSTQGKSASKEEEGQENFKIDKVVGTGSFGLVYQAYKKETGEIVAIKKVFQDKRYKNRELQILKSLHHPNIISLQQHFYSPAEKPDEFYLNLVMDFFPENIYRVSKRFIKNRSKMPMLLVKLYSYQMFRALAHTHRLGICHRDIKPQNLLVDPNTHRLSLCDFGSAKHLIPDEVNVSYICSRYYRAPELMFGAPYYTSAIDIWSAGSVLAEMIIDRPLFQGDSGIDQLVEVLKTLGTPTREEIHEMNPQYHEYKFPHVKVVPLDSLVNGDAHDLLRQILVYSPQKRPTAMQCLQHPFFDELREPDTRLPNGDPLPELFDWTDEERASAPREVLEQMEASRKFRNQ